MGVLDISIYVIYNKLSKQADQSLINFSKDAIQVLYEKHNKVYVSI